MPEAVVIDSNIVLDLFVFGDALALPLKQALVAGELAWLATPAMREELARVLSYPKIVQRLTRDSINAGDVLASFDRHTRMVDVAAKASVSCSDPDDQKFIDLAVAHKALLLSKDRAVISMQKRLVTLEVRVLAAI